MDKQPLMPADERKVFFEIAASKMGVSETIIEKDFWVVWTLRQLFAIDELKPHLTFKGGTSLSKIFDLIKRFSEDIDLSIEKAFFGFSGDDAPENISGTNKRRVALEALSKHCTDYVKGKLLSKLQSDWTKGLKKESSWTLLVDEEDRDQKTLLFEYPTSQKEKTGYLRPIIKIEIGARAEHWPVSEHKIQSYTKEYLTDKFNEPETPIRVLDVERTFWEKATILHQYYHLPETKELPLRLSRHYYDFSQLLKSNVKDKASANINLLERVANHKSVYFASAWANYGNARQGTLRLSPPDRIKAALEKDYNLMKDMFFEAPPSWKAILRTIEEFENEFNVIKI